MQSVAIEVAAVKVVVEVDSNVTNEYCLAKLVGIFTLCALICLCMTFYTVSIDIENIHILKFMVV